MKYSSDDDLPAITDQEFLELRQAAKNYSLVILKRGPEYFRTTSGDQEAIHTVLTHGMRNMRLNKAGLLPIVCPVPSGPDIAGIGVFAADVEEVTRIYEDDPAIRAGILTFEVFSCLGFPGSALP